MRHSLILLLAFVILGFGVVKNYRKINIIKPISYQPVKLETSVQKVIGSVVHIECPQWQGSGFVITKNVIATARHIVEGVEDFEITFNCGSKTKATKAISSKKHDVGFIWVDESMPPPVKLGSVKNVKLGQVVFSIGSTYGKQHFNAVANGVIQTLSLELENFGLRSDYGWSVLFGNTVEGGGGNSGGPLFTLDGKVIGVWVGSYQPNVHYCIPVDIFLEDLDILELLFLQDKYEVEQEIVEEWEWDGYID